MNIMRLNILLHILSYIFNYILYHLETNIYDNQQINLINDTFVNIALGKLVQNNLLVFVLNQVVVISKRCMFHNNVKNDFV